MTEERAEYLPATKGNNLEALLKDPNTQKRFNNMLKNKAPAFISSIMSITNSSENLRACVPASIISAALIAASLDLPINQNLGFAYIVPYRNKSGHQVAQFQMGWKGFVQLAQRTGQYQKINVSCVYEGEITAINQFTGDITFDVDGRYNDTIVGYVAYLKMLNGFEKYFYMTKEAVQTHGKKYSQSYSSKYGQWKLNFDAMAMKTVIKLLLSKFGLMTTAIQTAVRCDQAEITPEGDYNFIDNEKETKPETEIPKSKKKAPAKKKAADETPDGGDLGKPHDKDPALPGEKETIKSLLKKLKMTEESYFRGTNKTIEGLVRAEATAVLKDLASQLNDSLTKKKGEKK